MRFDLTDLRLFLHVAEAGSITAGAERAALALASASARIRGMEAAAGTALLQRGRRGVAPTPAGEAVLHHARLVLQQMERMRGELGDYARGLKGHVRILGNTAAVTEFLPEPLAEWLAAHPRIDIDLEERPSHAIVEAVAAGLADLGIVADMADGGAADGGDGLERIPFRIDRLVLAVPRGHPLAARRRDRLRRGAGRGFRRLEPRQRAAGPSRPPRRPGRAAAHAAGPARRLRRGVPDGGAGRRPGGGAGDGSTALPPQHGDPGGAAVRPLGAAPAVDLRPVPRRAAGSMRGGWWSICGRICGRRRLALDCHARA